MTPMTKRGVSRVSVFSDARFKRYLIVSGGGKRHPGLKRAFPWRGILNVAVLIILILALLCLFIFYPVLTFYQNSARNLKIDGNIRINATGQAPVLCVFIRYLHARCSGLP